MSDLQLYDATPVDAWDTRKRALFKAQLAPEISDTELDFFQSYCQSKRLDPFAGEVFAVMRWDGKLNRNKLTIQVGIDGFRSMAEETGEYDGSTLPIWCDRDCNWTDVWTSNEPPFACKVGVRRKGFSNVQYVIGRYSAYVQTSGKDNKTAHMWEKRGPEQLAKCVEACALRMAFPRRLGGIYTIEEMAQAENERPYVEAEARTASVSEEHTTEKPTTPRLPVASTPPAHTPAMTDAEATTKITAHVKNIGIEHTAFVAFMRGNNNKLPGGFASRQDLLSALVSEDHPVCIDLLKQQWSATHAFPGNSDDLDTVYRETLRTFDVDPETASVKEQYRMWINNRATFNAALLSNSEQVPETAIA